MIIFEIIKNEMRNHILLVIAFSICVCGLSNHSYAKTDQDCPHSQQTKESKKPIISSPPMFKKKIGKVVKCKNRGIRFGQTFILLNPLISHILFIRPDDFQVDSLGA